MTINAAASDIKGCCDSSVQFNDLRVAAAALAIPDHAASIFSAYCSGIRVDFHAPIA
jgi:hypothetical protein